MDPRDPKTAAVLKQALGNATSAAATIQNMIDSPEALTPGQAIDLLWDIELDLETALRLLAPLGSE